MNDQIEKMMLDATKDMPQGYYIPGEYFEKFASLIIKECARLNKAQSYELTGVIVDTEENDGFDSICLDTVKRVEHYLAGNTLKNHFGIEQ